MEDSGKPEDLDEQIQVFNWS